MTLGLFEGYGIELEYMIVDGRSLDVLPVSDEVLRAKAGRRTARLDAGPMSWSNEFVMHVIELQTVDPASAVKGLSAMYHGTVGEINAILAKRSAMLLPTSMHPWMNPRREARLWTGANRKVYETYDRIFGCGRHGWANIQSLQFNLSFSGDAQFGLLHGAVRILLPLLPALAASSPFVGGFATGRLDSRLWHYRGNQRLVPAITGRFVPERIASRREYQERILAPIYRGIAPHDPEKRLAHEWLNSRGAIARFDRSAIEVRAADIQECPASDMAIVTAADALLRALVGGRWRDPATLHVWRTRRLARILWRTARDGESAVIDDAPFLAYLGFPGKRAAAWELWRHLVEETLPRGVEPKVRNALHVILGKGTLARRILKATGERPSREHLREVYGELASCLRRGTPFVP